MMDPATQKFVQDLIRQEGRSMLQYVVESFPWTTPKNQAFLSDLNELAVQERDAAAELVKLLIKHHGRPPFLGAYPMSFTTINFVALEHLLPRLIRFQEERIADLSATVEHILNDDARAAVRQLLETKRRHLTRLQSLAARVAGSAA